MAKQAKIKDEGKGMKAEGKGRKDLSWKGGKAKAEKTAAREPAVEPEVLPKGEKGGEDAGRFCIVRHAEDFSSLERIEASILRDIALSGKLDKAGAMVGIKIGLALQSAKSLLKHGEYEGWVSARFGDAFSERKAQYFAKLAAAFLRSGEGSQLALPSAREAGNWLVVADEGSQLQKSVEAFVGDLTLGELLDKHGVRAAKAKGGYRPAEWLLKQYQDEHPNLKNKPFDLWPKEEREAFMEWQDRQVSGDDAANRRMAAEGTWHSVRVTLSDHGLGRKTWSLIPADQLAETRDIMSEVLKGINKAIKEG